MSYHQIINNPIKIKYWLVLDKYKKISWLSIWSIIMTSATTNKEDKLLKVKE